VIMDRESIKEITQSEGILPQSKFGQNFLCDENIISSIIGLCDICHGDRVLEIGPGLGSLTFPLSEITDDLTCVEIDTGLADYLSSRLAKTRIINADFIKTGINGTEAYNVVVSNIPYYVMTDIMKKLFAYYSNARRMVFMVEDEATARIDCAPRSKQYGPLAILCSLYGTYKYEIKVPHTAFVPQPRTTSAVISFSREETAGILSAEFVSFITSCFSMRRKLLKKNLSAVYSSAAADKAFDMLGIAPNSRAEELTPSQFAELFKTMRKVS